MNKYILSGIYITDLAIKEYTNIIKLFNSKTGIEEYDHVFPPSTVLKNCRQLHKHMYPSHSPMSSCAHVMWLLFGRPYFHIPSTFPRRIFDSGPAYPLVGFHVSWWVPMSHCGPPCLIVSPHVSLWVPMSHSGSPCLIVDPRVS